MRAFPDAVRSLAADWRFTAAAVALLSLTLGASTALGVGLTACWWPSRRAATADPIEALRAE